MYISSELGIFKSQNNYYQHYDFSALQYMSYSVIK